MLKINWIFLGVILTLLQGCDSNKKYKNQQFNQNITIYSGVTMIKPLQVLTQIYQKKHPNVQFNIISGASGYLLKSLLKLKTGDIYFPGSNSYRIKNQSLGIFKESIFVGYNRIAMIVKKGNPKNLTSNLNYLVNPNYSVVLASPDSGSIGKASYKLLKSAGLLEMVYQNITYFTTDSARLNNAIIKNEADVVLNWYATSQWPEYKNRVQAILLETKKFPPKKLELNLLSYSKKPQKTLDFMKFCGSKTGLKTFYNYGFLTSKEYEIAIKNLRK